MVKIKSMFRNKKSVVIMVTVLVLIGVGGYMAYSQLFNKDDKPRGVNQVDYGPPTKDEQKAGDEQKDVIAKEQEQLKDQEKPPTETKKKATVMITDAGQYDDTIEVRSWITNHYEDGTCTITFTLGDITVTKEAPAYMDATTTICTNPLIKRSEFPKSGEWKVVVTYESSGATGSSSAQTVNIK